MVKNEEKFKSNIMYRIDTYYCCPKKWKIGRTTKKNKIFVSLWFIQPQAPSSVSVRSISAGRVAAESAVSRSIMPAW
jgi:hypothetical protein